MNALIFLTAIVALYAPARAQNCTEEEQALTTCLSAETNGFFNFIQPACEGCLNLAAAATANLGDCDSASNSACFVLQGCNGLCSPSCNDEARIKLSCDLATFRDGDDCPMLNCTAPTQSPPTTAPPSTPAPTVTRTAAPTPTPICNAERTTFDSCLDTIPGLNEFNKGACSLCVGAAAQIGNVAALIPFVDSCEQAATSACAALEFCETACSTGCTTETEARVTCEINNNLDEGNACSALNCAALTPAPTPTPICVEESAALDTCWEATAGLNEVERNACSICIDATAELADISSQLPFIDDCALLSSAICDSLDACEVVCGTVCSAETETRLTCEINTPRQGAAQCAALDCAASPTTHPPTMSPLTPPPFGNF